MASIQAYEVKESEDNENSFENAFQSTKGRRSKNMQKKSRRNFKEKEESNGIK